MTDYEMECSKIEKNCATFTQILNALFDFIFYLFTVVFSN